MHASLDGLADCLLWFGGRRSSPPAQGRGVRADGCLPRRACMGTALATAGLRRAQPARRVPRCARCAALRAPRSPLAPSVALSLRRLTHRLLVLKNLWLPGGAGGRAGRLGCDAQGSAAVPHDVAAEELVTAGDRVDRMERCESSAGENACQRSVPESYQTTHAKPFITLTVQCPQICPCPHPGTWPTRAACVGKPR